MRTQKQYILRSAKGRLLQLLVLGFFVFSSCLKKDIPINLPAFQKQVGVECYLGPLDTTGIRSRFALLIQENIHLQAAVSYTQDYFKPVNLNSLEVHGATVSISYDSAGKTYTDVLTEDSILDLNDTSNVKLYNYKNFISATNKVHFHTGLQYNLRVDDHQGHVVTGNTQWLDTVHIDNVTTLLNAKDTTYSLITHWKDYSPNTDYYRLQIRILNIKDSIALKKRGRPVKMDVAFSDESYNTSNISIGTDFEFKTGDMVEVKLFHIRKEYYDYLRTVRLAVGSMGNPFGQPATIASNVSGGLGIFTPLPWTKTILILK